MKPGWVASIPRALFTAACVAYPLVSYWASQHAGRRPIAVALAWGPLALIAAWLIWRSKARLPLALLAAAALAVLWRERAVVMTHYQWAYLAEHVGSITLLGLMFGTSLRAGSVPLVTRFAAMVRQSMPPAVLRYTRGVTIAWTAFFVGMAATSVALFARAPFRDWALFASAWTPGLVLAMFVAEYGVRRLVLPPDEHSGPYEAFRAYWLYRAGRSAAVGTPGGAVPAQAAGRDGGAASARIRG